MSTDARPAPRLRTLAEVDAAIGREEALLARYRFELEELEAEGEATVRAGSWCASSSGGSRCSACGGSRAPSPG